MIYDVTQEVGAVDFAPASRTAEILQNVRTILTTLKKSVPMDREFGISGEVVDLPIASAQARLTSEIVAAVNKYEPRAQALGVFYRGDGEEGVLNTTVKVRLRDETA
mgnify:FL=1